MGCAAFNLSILRASHSFRCGLTFNSDGVSLANSDILGAVWVRNGAEPINSDHIAMHCSFHQWQKIIKIQIVSVFPVQMMLIWNPRFFVAIISQILMFHAPNIFSEFVDSTYDLLHQFLECQCLPSWSMVHVILNIESLQPTYMTNSIKLNMLDGTDEDRKVRFASVFCQLSV